MTQCWPGILRRNSKNCPSYRSSKLKSGNFVSVTVSKAGLVQSTFSHVKLSLIYHNRLPMDRGRFCRHLSIGSQNITKIVFLCFIQPPIFNLLFMGERCQKHPENFLRNSLMYNIYFCLKRLSTIEYFYVILHIL